MLWSTLQQEALTDEELHAVGAVVHPATTSILLQLELIDKQLCGVGVVIHPATIILFQLELIDKHFPSA